MNYRQPLRSGAFLTPSSSSPGSVVARSVRCEELGFDLAVFQDHPYLPSQLEMWTLLSWVAARTARIHLAPGVVSIPLRDPVMLARSAASLDLLTGGRVDLGLGAGFYWDEIGSMGGPVRSPREAVQALSEAIDLIQGVLDVSSAQPLSYRGERYTVSGIQRGPIPAHRIPLWVGGYRRKMLALIGQKADGWMPSLVGDQPEGVQDTLVRGNAAIDEAARQAGRDPAEIRRLLNISGRFGRQAQGFLDGPPSRWVEDLTPLAVEAGFSTFILGSDDDDVLERFAQEVWPALREAVDRALPEPLPPNETRPRSVIAQRRVGIDYAGVPASLADSAIEPGDIDYPKARSTRMRGGSPGIVLRPGTVDDVVDAVGFARAHLHLPLGIRSGGHGVSGRSTNDGGIVIDLCRLRAISALDEAAHLVRVGPGATWRDVATSLAPHGWALSSGDFGGVGVGGLTVSGGIGLLNRSQGLTIDCLRAVQIVLADGAVVEADERDHSDLFWAVRGAGANMGIITAFDFEASQVTNVGWAQLICDASDPARFLQQFGAAAAAAPRDTTAFLTASPAYPQLPLAHISIMVNNAAPDVLMQRLLPFLDITTVHNLTADVAPYAAIIGAAPDFPSTAQGEPIIRSALVDAIGPELAAGLADILRSGAAYMLQVRTIGGAVADVAPDATAFPYRQNGFSIAAMGVNAQRMNESWDSLRPHFDSLYIAFESDSRPERIAEAYPPTTLQRLRAVKSRYDPENLFRDNFNIEPIGEESHA